jgi:predicted  nucleic acid-binding Zn-ribbon protein
MLVPQVNVMRKRIDDESSQLDMSTQVRLAQVDQLENRIEQLQLENRRLENELNFANDKLAGSSTMYSNLEREVCSDPAPTP